MIIKGLRWGTSDEGWGEDYAEVEYFDGAQKRNITASELDNEWTVFFTDNDIMDAILEGEFDPNEDAVRPMEGALIELLPTIIRSPFGADICFAMQALDNYPSGMDGRRM